MYNEIKKTRTIELPSLRCNSNCSEGNSRFQNCRAFTITCQHLRIYTYVEIMYIRKDWLLYEHRGYCYRCASCQAPFILCFCNCSIFALESYERTENAWVCELSHKCYEQSYINSTLLLRTYDKSIL